MQRRGDRDTKPDLHEAHGARYVVSDSGGVSPATPGRVVALAVAAAADAMAGVPSDTAV